MLQQNKEIVTRWLKESWEANLDDAMRTVDELGADGLVYYYPIFGHRLEGRDAVKNIIMEVRKAFPDISIEMVGDPVAEGDYVVSRWEVGCTNTGHAIGSIPGGSVPAAVGKKLHWSGMSMFRVENGKIAEEAGHEDYLALLRQLGLVPPR
jgi:steroid delta-isomerase-like uncharacterized protein